MGVHELTELQKEIDAHLEKDIGKYTESMLRKVTKGKVEDSAEAKSSKCMQKSEKEIEMEESRQFIEASNAEAIKEFIANNTDSDSELDTKPQSAMASVIEGLRPDIEAICRVTESELEDVERAKQPMATELFVDDLNDDELDQYVLTEEEADTKLSMWKNLNAEFLREQKEREERMAKEREEGKPEKKKRKPRKKVIGPSSTAGEAIEKMLQEKKISSKINYDILKTLTEGMGSFTSEGEISAEDPKPKTLDELAQTPAIVEDGPISSKQSRGKPSYDMPGPSRKRVKVEAGLPVSQAEEQLEAKPEITLETGMSRAVCLWLTDSSLSSFCCRRVGRRC